jgi:ribonuclease HII
MRASPASPAASASNRPYPDLAVEQSMLAAGHTLVGGIDEVGRGAWAGPLVVGVVLLDASTGPLPEGTRDSKLLTPRARSTLRPTVAGWCAAWALGEVSAAEIDKVGLTKALRIAASRAIAALPHRPSALIVDGPVDFVTPDSLGGRERQPPIGVQCVVGADGISGSVAAASILAKVARDDRMRTLGSRHPDYGFERHKGYGTSAHAAAIDKFGLCGQHRRSWSFAESSDGRRNRLTIA